MQKITGMIVTRLAIWVGIAVLAYVDGGAWNSFHWTFGVLIAWLVLRYFSEQYLSPYLRRKADYAEAEVAQMAAEIRRLHGEADRINIENLERLERLGYRKEVARNVIDAWKSQNR